MRNTTSPTEGLTMPSSTDVPISSPSTNGELINRVQQLRLDSQLGRGPGGGGRGAWLPWVLCGLMAIAWVGVGVRYYKSNSTGSDASSGSAANAGPNPANPQQSTTQPDVKPGELVLHLKG